MSINDYLTDFVVDMPDISGKDVHAVGVHVGWLNWGSVGDETIDKLIDYYDAEKFAEFERPGDFYDFVAYRERSMTYVDNKGIRQTEYPNSRAYYVKRDGIQSDLILLNLLEPNHFSEIWVDRVVTLLKSLNISRYVVAGAMGSPVPHTRPIKITGRSSDPKISQDLEMMGVRQTIGHQYQGPTSIFNMISQKLTGEGITTVNLMAHMPSHITLQEPDFTGVHKLLSILAGLESIDIPLEKTRIAGKRQYERISKEVRHSPSLSELSKQLEDIYDEEEDDGASGEDGISLPPNIQKAIDEAFGRD